MAVNPWWGYIDTPFHECAAHIAALSGATFYMPRWYYRQKWDNEIIGPRHLSEACSELGESIEVTDLLRHLTRPEPMRQMILMTNVMDASRDLRHNISWKEEVVHQISQFSAAYFDKGQSVWQLDSSLPPYPSWKRIIVHNRGIELIMGARGLCKLFGRLPDDRDELITSAVDALAIPASKRVDYFEALLRSISGWASWYAQRRWQSKLQGASEPDSSIRDLLAMRLGWEWVLMHYARERNLSVDWSEAVRSWSKIEDDQLAGRKIDRIWHRAFELADQEPLVHKLGDLPHRSEEPRPEVAAYFCIDVRSEPFRRSLEAQDPHIRTGGFAGFFGLPITYQAAGLDVAVPHLPGLLAPSRVVHDGCAADDCSVDEIAYRRRGRLLDEELLEWMKTTASSMFSYVESAGLLYGLKLIKEAAVKAAPYSRAYGLAPEEKAQLVPRVALESDEAVGGAIELAAGILRTMSLTESFPAVVLLMGHGSTTQNNPQAAGLHCGACCGQTGDVNARALAGLLNEPRIREGLHAHGIDLTESTVFVAGLHDTTTDEARLFDTDAVPPRFSEAIRKLSVWLERAGEATRAERAPRLNIKAGGKRDLLSLFRRRSRDWSEVRPEWGLTRNASLIVAPRSRTRDIDLEGRSFLHDYDWTQDTNFSVLELIMTAPMVVSHWINMQYYASTVDNLRYGSGNKVLHNVVGGNIGIFEGNGGDLRIGLAMQSLHDGTDWVHEPVRLNVYIDAPQHAIDTVMERQEVVRHLVNNGWLHLFQLDDGSTPIFRRTASGWEPHYLMTAEVLR